MQSKTVALFLGLVTLTPVAGFAGDVKVLAGDLPPMFHQDGTGREAEIIKAVMEHCGHTVTFEIQPFTRHWQSYENGTGDAVATVPVGMPISGTTTGSYIAYQNGVSYLSSSPTAYASLEDLGSRSVIGFQGASEIIPGLADHVGSFGSYREMADQETQSKMLYGGRADGIIGDGMLFAEFSRNLASADAGVDASQPTEFGAIFEPSPYVMAFRNASLAADFDRCFAELDSSGDIEAINVKWVEKYRAWLGDNYLGY